MDPPLAAEVETKSNKTDNTENGKSYDCGLCDTEVVYKIAQELLPGLASACVDNTTGGIFKSAGSVAVDMRKEMADYLTQRSETYVAEFSLSENASMLELSEHPYDIIINLIDDFASSKTNMFSRVSEWVLSDRREDRIDDFVQEMEINGFWLLAQRECVASMLLKNVDYKNAFHCNMVCRSEEEIIKHRSECKFRPMDCTNEGCTTRYCAAQKEHHEAVCPFMILPCEQKCSDYVIRREMDRHCVTVCPMKFVNCTFYTVGCKSSIPRCNVQQHNADELSSHLLYIIRTVHKEASDEDLKHRVEQIRSLSNTEKLARARDTRALTYLVKDAEAKLGPLDVKTKPHAESLSHVDNNKKESPTKTKPSIIKDGSDSQSANEIRSLTEKPVITEDDTKLPTEEVVSKSPRSGDSPVKIEENKDKVESDFSLMEEHEQSESPVNNEVFRDLQKDDGKEFAAKEQSTKVKEELSNTVREELDSSDEEETKESFKEVKIKQLSSSDEEDTKKLPPKETVKESSRSDEESTKKETVKESTHQREKTHESLGSDEEESRKI